MNHMITAILMLRLQISLIDRLKIAVIRSATIEQAAPEIDPNRTIGSVLSVATVEKKSQLPLKLGFLSYDFNNHPTAHLIEALFETVVDCRVLQEGLLCKDVHMGILNYGPNDNSEYRRRLEEKADSMHDMPLQSHFDSAQYIQTDGVDILLDLQLHTLGNRAGIVAAHPAPLVVNYLVYPGTCGSSQHEYVVADRIVIPAEVCFRLLNTVLFNFYIKAMLCTIA